MSLFNVDITNTGTFSDQTENHGVIRNGIFEDSALNTGTIQLTAKFSSNSINQGTVQSTSIFSGSAINYGVTKTTTFSGNSINMGTVSGNAYFTEYSKNSGTVIGNALFAPSATNIGVVSGRIGIYPPINGHNSTGYYQSGIELMSYVQRTPQLAIDNNLYYTYLSGNTFLANGPYSNYFINVSGLIDQNKNTTTPQSGLDNGIFYLYNNGNAISFISGAYSN
jgi:hypothetical protein